jgi:mannosyltransferase
MLLLALTAVLASFRLGEKGIWHDEAFTLAVARSDGQVFWRSLIERESFSALYYSIVRLLPPVWGSEAALRIPSVVFAVLAAFSCFAIAKDLFGDRVAAFSLLLLSINLTFVRYAQEARTYALTLFLVTLAGWLLVRAVERPSWARWLTLAAISALAIYAHFLATFVLVGFAVSLILHRSLVPWRKAAASAGLITVLVAPLAVVLVITSAGDRPQLAQSSLSGMVGGLAGTAPTHLGRVGIAVYGFCCVAAAVAFMVQRRERGDAFLEWRYTFLACWAALPVALGALASLVWPVFVLRYFVVCLSPLVVLIAVGLSSLWKPVQVVALIVVALVAAQGLRLYYGQDYKEGENWRELVDHVAQEAQPGDEVLFLSRFGRRPFEYYLARHPGAASMLQPEYPAVAWGEYPPVVGEGHVGNTADRARHLRMAAPGRVWVVLLWGGFRTGDDEGAPFHRVLEQYYEQCEHLFYGRYLKLALFTVGTASVTDRDVVPAGGC